MAAFRGIAFDVIVSKEALYGRLVVAAGEANDHDMHVGFAPRIASPGECTMGERDLQPAAPEQHGPELRDLFTLRDGVRPYKTDAGVAFLKILTGLDEPCGHIVERPTRSAEAGYPADLGALFFALIFSAREGRIAE